MISAIRRLAENCDKQSILRSAITMLVCGGALVAIGCYDVLHEADVSRKNETRFTAISAGYAHTCALSEDGSAICWGSSDEGEASPPQGEKFVVISSGSSHNCALRKSGIAVCWGSDYEGKASPPEGEKFIAISAGNHHTCALKDDMTPVCWGANWSGQSSPPAGLTLTAISSGHSDTCGLTEDGFVECWGYQPCSIHFCKCIERDDGSAFCGDGRELSPAPQPSKEKYTAFDIGSSPFYCGLLADGSPDCWGTRTAGGIFYLGDVPHDEKLKFLSSGYSHVCGLREDGSPLCWGDDRDGAASPPKNQTFVAIASGGKHTCALRRDGSAVCWGAGDLGQDLPPTIATATPVPPSVGICNAGLVVPKRSGCILPVGALWGVNVFVHRFAVTASGIGEFYDEGGSRLGEPKYTTIFVGHSAINGESVEYKFIAHANDDGGWTVDVAGWKGEDWREADLPQR